MSYRYSWRFGHNFSDSLDGSLVPDFTMTNPNPARVTCATLLGEAALNALEISSVTGHQSRAMVDHYTHATEQTHAHKPRSHREDSNLQPAVYKSQAQRRDPTGKSIETGLID